MLYSQTAHSSGASGFFLDDDKNAPPDAFPVSDADFESAVNIQAGYTYAFAAPANGAEHGVLTTAAPSAASILSQEQAAQTSLIEQSRDVARFANVTATVGGASHVWQADAKSVDLLNGAISLAQAGLPLPPSWRTYDNVDVPINSLADLLAIGGAIAQQTQAAYAKSWALKAQIAAATTVAAVQAIVW